MDGVMANDEISVKRSREDSELDDIHVPGLGVRSALADDGPENPQIWSWARNTYSRQAELVWQWTNRALRAVSLAGSGQVVKLAKVADEGRLALIRGRRLAVDMANLAAQRLRKTHRHLANDAHIAVLKLRSAIAADDQRARSIARILQERRGEFLRMTQCQRAQIDKVCKQGWTRISEEIVRQSRRRQVFLAGTVAGSRTVRMPFGRGVSVRLSRNFQFDLTTLRRALPALTVLLVIVTFVFQAALVASKR